MPDAPLPDVRASLRDLPVTLKLPDEPVIVRPDREAVQAVDDDRARPRAARRDDGLFSAYAVSPWSPPVADWAARRGLMPGTVSAVSLAFGVLAALWFSDGTRGGLAAGALLLYASLVLDRVDGLLARWTSQTSQFGAWLDALSDRVKELAVYAGLAAGAGIAVPGGHLEAAWNPWGPAVAAVALLSVRHTIEVSYAAGRDARRDRPSRRNPVLRRALRSLGLPLGERFALISVTAAFAGPRPVFAVLLAWSSAATACVLARRVMRSITS